MEQQVHPGKLGVCGEFNRRESSKETEHLRGGGTVLQIRLGESERIPLEGHQRFRDQTTIQEIQCPRALSTSRRSNRSNYFHQSMILKFLLKEKFLL